MRSAPPGKGSVDNGLEGENARREQARQPTESQRRNQDGKHGKDKVVPAGAAREMYQGEHRHNVREQGYHGQRPEVQAQVDHQRNC